jgi:hypothetical protein
VCCGGAAVGLGWAELVGCVVVAATVVVVPAGRFVVLVGATDVDGAGVVDTPAVGRGLELPQAASSASDAIAAVQVGCTPVA